MNNSPEFSETELQHLERCVELAEEALAAGDQPFGSILVNEENKIIASKRNRIKEMDNTAHPEIELARWAAAHLSPQQRRKTKMYTSGEHCPMCAAAHGWVGLGEIIYIHSGKQLGEWLKEFNVPSGPIRYHPIQDIIKEAKVRGPVPALVAKMKKLHRTYYKNFSE